MKISELAERVGLPAKTIRYYESRGVIPPPERLSNGYRTYSAEDERRLRTVAAARDIGLPNWNRPSGACLATRIPYGVRLSEALLERVDRAEAVLRRSGVDGCRVRVHDNVARVEADPLQFDRIMDSERRLSLVEALRALGFDHVALDLEGYRTGSMNRALKDED